jgi:hypothetical protein
MGLKASLSELDLKFYNSFLHLQNHGYPTISRSGFPPALAPMERMAIDGPPHLAKKHDVGVVFPAPGIRSGPILCNRLYKHDRWLIFPEECEEVLC